jgi:hypothetical protein
MSCAIVRFSLPRGHPHERWGGGRGQMLATSRRRSSEKQATWLVLPQDVVHPPLSTSYPFFHLLLVGKETRKARHASRKSCLIGWVTLGERSGEPGPSISAFLGEKGSKGGNLGFVGLVALCGERGQQAAAGEAARLQVLVVGTASKMPLGATHRISLR